MIRLTTAILLAALLLSIGGAAVADPDGVDTTAGDDWFDSSAESVHDPEVATSQVAVDTNAGTTYSYDRVCVRGDGISGTGFYGCGGQMECGQDGHMFYVWAHRPGETSQNLGAYCFQPDEVDTSQQVTPAAVLEAFRRIPVPASEVVIQPPGGKTLVNLDTIFSTEAEGFARTVGLLGHRVELDIWPSQFRWVNGDGTEQVTDWAGRSWAEDVAMNELITHIYDDAEGVSTRVDTTWSAKYRVDGGSWRDVGGTVTIAGESFDLKVLSASPALVG